VTAAIRNAQETEERFEHAKKKQEEARADVQRLRDGMQF